MRRLLFVTVIMVGFVYHPARAELVNDFSCTLNKGYTVPALYAFQKQWMAAARQQGFTAADYNTRIYFPVYSEVTTTDPMFFVWRGQFTNGAVLGKMLDWFPASVWAAKFGQVMNCGKASLWIAFQ